MRILLFSALVILTSVSALSHDDTSYNNEAKAILDKVAERYFSHKSVELHFSLSIVLAEKPKRNEKGRLVQLGDKFKVEMEDQDIYCNGASLWYHIKGQNEVQINDYEGGEDVGVISPADLLKQYESDEYHYALIKDESTRSNTVEIEFKPKDTFSDYSKLRVSINTIENTILNVKAFGKDGSRFNMDVDKEYYDLIYDQAFFEFDPVANPGVNIEDLRL